MEGDPGSMSAYARAKRDMFGKGEGGPIAYGIKCDSISKRKEMIAPFDTTGTRLLTPTQDGPGPIYFPFKRDRWQRGSPLMRCCFDRFHEKIDFDARCSDAEPVWGRIADPWVLMTDKILAMASKRPRISYDKYVSNNCPTIYHPLTIRCFIKGIDGREYPWRLNQKKSPGPANYNTYKIYISQSKITPHINFGAASERKSIFGGKVVGPGPAGYFVRRPPPNGDTGKFLGERYDDPNSSAWRLFDLLSRQMERENFCGPACVTIPSCFDKASPKAVLAPFKSNSQQGFVKPLPGPGPAAHFVVEMQESDLLTRLKPGLTTFPPEKAPFDTSEERFEDPSLYEIWDRPSPADYTILGFTDIMLYEIAKHPAAFVNPKLGFLSSADARPPHKEKGDINIVTDGTAFSSSTGLPGCHCLCEKPRKWRNMRPRSGKTYGYNGRPPKSPDSPGPIYDAAPGTAAIKARKSWLDPRNVSRNGFLNSGCQRRTDFFNIDKDIPGAGKYYSKLPCCRSYLGKRTLFGPRFKDRVSDSPGPVHKLHEKCDAMWRASHLGTFNADLKHVGLLNPWSGGFIKKNMNQAGDAVWGIKREDDYAEALCPKTLEMAKLGHVHPKSRNSCP